MSEADGRLRQDRDRVYGYVLAVVGTVGLAAMLIPVRDSMQAATVALLMVASVLTAATLGGRGPAYVAAALGFLSLDLFHTTPYYRLKMDQVEEVEVAVVFGVIALLAGEIAVRALSAREEVLRTEFREARVERVLASASAGVGRDQLEHMVEHELADALDLEVARYEPEAVTTCHYWVDTDGRLYHRNDPLTGPRRKWPAEPVAVAVRAGGARLGQLVLIAPRSRPVSDEELTLAQTMASLLGGLLTEAR